MDIDADLLALAGDDSSDEGNTPVPNSTAKAPSPLPPARNSSTNAKDSPATLKNSTSNASTKVLSAKRTKKRKEDSEEEGEA